MVHYKDVAREIATDIVKDSKKRAQQAIDYVAQQIRDDWEQQAHRVMDAYYSDYRSDLYDRTDELKNIIVPVFNQKGNSYVVGVEFDYSRMDHGVLPKFNEYSIFENFMYGAHGNEDYTVSSSGRKITRDIHFTHPHARQILDNYYNNYDAKFERFWKEALLKF